MVIIKVNPPNGGKNMETDTYKYKVSAVNKLSNNVIEVAMSPEDKEMSFNAGQYISVSFHGEGLNTEKRFFSIASSPLNKDLKIIIKALGENSAKMQTIKPGFTAEIEGPQGTLTYKNGKNKEQIWIAGGIGITPFLSMARNLMLSDTDYKVDMYYCANNEEELLCLKELQDISREDDEFNIILFCANNEGFLNARIVQNKSGELEKKDIFLCGPSVMVDSLQKQFIELGVNAENIHTDK